MRLGIPILASIIRDRPVALAISGFAVVQEILVLTGLPGWPCPMLHVLGIPCPGCGLSRAIGALLRGDWNTMVTFHLFAPIFVVGLFLVAVAAILPEKPRQQMRTYVEMIERRSGVTALLLIGLMLYWVARLATDPSAFIHLIRS